MAGVRKNAKVCAAIVAIFSQRESGREEDTFGVAVIFDAGDELLIYDGRNRLSLGPPTGKVHRELMGLIQCSPKRLIRWVRNAHFAERRACERCMQLIGIFTMQNDDRGHQLISKSYSVY